MIQKPTQIAVFAGGCFWCTEAVFRSLKGVVSIQPGYTGGNLENPTYDTVRRGLSGHAEAVKIEFDPTVISYADLLTVFFYSHDPTTLDKQGNDIGTQYRSAIFYVDQDQQNKATMMIDELDKAHAYEISIVTQVVPLQKFYSAEDNHHDYFSRGQNDPYCQIIIAPKLNKLEERFHKLMKRVDKSRYVV